MATILFDSKNVRIPKRTFPPDPPVDKRQQLKDNSLFPHAAPMTSSFTFQPMYSSTSSLVPAPQEGASPLGHYFLPVSNGLYGMQLAEQVWWLIFPYIRLLECNPPFLFCWTDKGTIYLHDAQLSPVNPPPCDSTSAPPVHVVHPKWRVGLDISPATWIRVM
eukprot:GGOE01004921.1.p5 GENE.GGOE01004921.1~~GGOE01004921.1.p5  ORF type:complete len:162 (-),score=21.87 GGOE01004921.1:812-1297(-)